MEIFVLQVYASSPGLRGSLLDNWHINFLFSHIDHQNSQPIAKFSFSAVRGQTSASRELKISLRIKPIVSQSSKYFLQGSYKNFQIMEFRFCNTEGRFVQFCFQAGIFFPGSINQKLRKSSCQRIYLDQQVCVLYLVLESVLARELRSPFLTSIFIGFKHLEGVPRYLICFLATQYILRNLLCSKT